MQTLAMNTIGGGGLSPPDAKGAPPGGPPPNPGEFSEALASQIGDAESLKKISTRDTPNTQDRTELEKALKDGRLKEEKAQSDGDLAKKDFASSLIAADAAIQREKKTEDLKKGAKAAGDSGIPSVNDNALSAALAAANAMGAKPAEVSMRSAGGATKSPSEIPSVLKRTAAAASGPSAESLGTDPTDLMRKLQSAMDEVRGMKQDLKQSLEKQKTGFSSSSEPAQPLVIAMPIVLQVPSPEVHILPMVPVEVMDSHEETASGMGGHGRALSSGIGHGSTEELVNVMTGLSRARSAAEMWSIDGNGQRRDEGADSEKHNSESALLIHNLFSGNKNQGPLPSVDGSQTTMATASFGAESGGRVKVGDAWQMAQVVHGLATQGTGSVRLKLHPEVLGEMVVSLEQTRGASGKRDLMVTFDATTDQAREALANTLGELRQALKAKDGGIGKLDIQIAGSTPSSVIAAGVMNGQSLTASKSLDGAFDMAGQNFSQHQGSQQGQSQSQGFYGSLGEDRGRGHSESLWERFYGQGGQGGQKRYNPRQHYAGAEL